MAIITRKFTVTYEAIIDTDPIGAGEKFHPRFERHIEQKLKNISSEFPNDITDRKDWENISVENNVRLLAVRKVYENDEVSYQD